MGQKINPTGFRTGVNQAHKATWFANYSAYSEVLKEDYKIRTFFEKKFDSRLNFLTFPDKPIVPMQLVRIPGRTIKLSNFFFTLTTPSLILVN